MSKPATKTRIVADGLRYQSKMSGSPFLQGPNFKQSMMSCFLCGTHRVRSGMTTRKLIGKQQAVCAPSCKAAKEADLNAIKQHDRHANFDDNAQTDESICQHNKEGVSMMATAKKVTSQTITTPVVKSTATKAKPAAKAAPKVASKTAIKAAPVSITAKAIAKISASISKLTERKDAILAEIKTLREQRAALKNTPVVTPAPAAVPAKVKAKAASKAAAKPGDNAVTPSKTTKKVAKKK